MSNITWNYDNESGRYIIRNARILYANFQGEARGYNAAGKRNFKIIIPDDLAKELKQRGVFVTERESREFEGETEYLIKIGVYDDAEIRMISGRVITPMAIDSRNPDNDDSKDIDGVFRSGHVRNGEIKLEFHVSVNTKVVGSSPYLRVDTVVIPIRKSRLLEELEEFENSEDPFDN